MSDFWKILILAVIQGAAELLPVSSSAHVILAEKLMGLDPSSKDMTFLLVMLHTGTMVAVLVYYWRRWAALLAPRVGDPSRPSLKHFLLAVVVASAATAVLGGGLILGIEEILMKRVLGWPKGEVEDLFKSLPLVGTALLAAGVVILVAGYREDRQGKRPLTWVTALWIGLIQGVCIPFRGFSRSGVTISTGMLCGVPRSLAEEFSFALAVVLTPAAIAYEGWRLLRDKEWQSHADLLALLKPGLIGMVLSCVAGLIALRFLSAMLDKGRWKYFGYYCIVAALVMFTVALVK
jgi:undecaprenyl-diphosphatase